MEKTNTGFNAMYLLMSSAFCPVLVNILLSQQNRLLNFLHLKLS